MSDDPLAPHRLAELQRKMSFEPGYTLDERTIRTLIVAYERLAHEHQVVIARLQGLLAEINPRSS